MSAGRTILLFHAAALGDFGFTWPISLALARLHPHSRVFYVTHGQKGQLVRRVLRLEALDVESGWSALDVEGAEPPEACRRRLADSHTIVNFAHRADELWERNVRRWAPDALLLGIKPAVGDQWAGPAWRYLIDQLNGQQALHAAAGQCLQAIQRHGLGARKAQSDGPIMLHVGSGSDAKCWPLAHFVQLAHLLKQSGRKVRFVAGEAERERLSPTQLTQLQSVAPLLWPQTLVELWDLLGGAAAYVGGDSGPTHLAAMSGLPTVALYGPTDPQRWGPVGPAVKVLAAARWVGIDPPRVLAHLGEK